MKNFSTPNAIKWIGIALVSSICIHIGLLLNLHNHSIHTSTFRQRALMDHHVAVSEPRTEMIDKNELAKSRTQELSTIFHALTADPIAVEEPLPAIVESEPIEIVEAPEAEDLGLELPNEIVGTESLRFELGTLPSTFEIASDPHTLLAELGELESLQPNHQASGEELIQATKLLFGAIVSEIAEAEATEDSLTIGGLETTPIQGNSFSEREGLFDHGFSDLEADQSGMLMSSMEIETLKDELLKRTKGASTGTTFPLQPNSIPLPNGLGSYIAAKAKPIASESLFSCKVEYAPKRDMTGYYFRLSFSSKEENQLQRIPQNYLFLIDRSRSIRPQRYEITKFAVAQALDFLQKGDSFNIFVFDDTVDSFSASSTPWSKNNIAKAKKFLAEQKTAKTFSSTDLSSSLAHLLLQEHNQDKVNTAILLSDGDTFLSKIKQRKAIADWTEKNHGEIALFSVCCGRGNNLALLDLLSAFNRGMLFHAASDKNLDETLSMLLYGIKNPLGKEVVATSVFPEGIPQSKITLFPSQKRLANIYEQIPYVLYGSTDKLENFHIFLQGRDREGTLTIKEFVDFGSADRIAPQELEQAWAVQQSYDLYAQFLHDGNNQHLQTIKRLLSPYKLTAAFQ
jgi:hypothetical protein